MSADAIDRVPVFTAANISDDERREFLARLQSLSRDYVLEIPPGCKFHYLTARHSPLELASGTDDGGAV